MRVSNANFDLEIAQEVKATVFILEIFEDDGTTTLDRFMNIQHPTIAIPASKTILDPPQSVSQKVVPEEGESSISGITFGLTDVDLVITKLIATTSLRKKKVEMKIGFLNLAEADFLIFFRGVIEDIKLRSDFLGYMIEARDPQVFGNEVLFEPVIDELDGSIGSGDTSITLDDASGFPDPTVFTSAALLGKFYISIDGKEIASYQGKTGDTLTTVVRGEKGTTAIAHSDGKKVSEIVVLGDGGINPLTAMLQILLSTGDFGQPSQNGPFDVLPANWGLAIPQDQIDDSDITTKRDAEIPGLKHEFRLGQREQAKRFVTEEFHRNLGAYPIILGNGKLSIRFFLRPIPFATLQKFNTTNVRKVSSYVLNLDRTYNNLAWDVDWNPLTKENESRLSFTDPESITNFGLQPLRIYQSKGMRISLQASTFASDRSGVIFFRFGQPPPSLKTTNHFSTMLAEAGDHIFFTDPLTPDIRNGVRGLGSAIMEITERRIDMVGKKVDTTLQFVSLTRNYALYGPDTLLDAASESDENRALYGFYADASGEIAGPGGVGRVPGDLYA